MCKCKHLPHSHVPQGCTVHAKLCTAQPQGSTQKGASFVYVPFVYWKMGAYQNATPVLVVYLGDLRWYGPF